LFKYKKACATLSYNAKNNYQKTFPPPKKPRNLQTSSPRTRQLAATKEKNTVRGSEETARLEGRGSLWSRG
jgi:hypothetical protein